jgi:hypothetical protein
MQAILRLPFTQIQNQVVRYGQVVVARVATRAYAWAVAIGAEVVSGVVEHAHESAVDRAARYVHIYLI